MSVPTLNVAFCTSGRLGINGSWNTNPLPSNRYYELWRSDLVGGVFQPAVQIQTVNVTFAWSVYDDTAVLGSSYQYYCYAVDPPTTRTQSNIVTGTYFNTVSSATIAIVSSIGTTITLSWSATLGALEYQIERNGVLVSPTTMATSATFTGTVGVMETFRVRALNTCGMSLWSSPVSITPTAIPDPPHSCCNWGTPDPVSTGYGTPTAPVSTWQKIGC